MRIVDLDCILLTSPHRQPDRLRSYAVVTVKTDDGYVGVGEPYAGVNLPTVCREMVHQLRPLFIGTDAADFASAVAHAHRVAEYFDHRGLVSCVIGAIDWALHDLAAQRVGVPLHRLLNDRSKSSVELYASTGVMTLSHEQLTEEINHRIAEGYGTIKVRVGCGLETPSKAIRRAQVAADAVGDRVRLGVDAGQQIFVRKLWTLVEAMQVNAALGELGLLFYEDPFLITDLPAYQQLRKMSSAPIAGGEMFHTADEFERYCQSGAFDIAQPDACVLSGPAATLAAVKAAGRYGVPAYLHGWAGPVAQLQNIHAALASDNCDLVEFCPLLHPLLSDGLLPVWQFCNGRLAAPALAGMGAAPIDELAEQYPFQNVSMLIA